MRLSKKVVDSITDDLIVRINEIYHDIENATYQNRHQSMFSHESETWRDLTERFITSARPIVCLDYGSGTGFVPLTVAPKLKSGDTIICADLSDELLKTCESNLDIEEISCVKQFKKVDGASIPMPPDSVNIVTLNSVLHHVPNLSCFAAEVLRVLKPGGRIIVAHEPNAGTRLPFPVRSSLKLVNIFISPSRIVFSTVEKSALLEAMLRRILSKVSQKYTVRNKMLDDISNLLIEEGYVDFKLRGTEVQQLVDIHTAKGLSKEAVLGAFADFETVEWRTYGIVPQKNDFLKKLNALLEQNYPESGGSFSFVLSKPN